MLSGRQDHCSDQGVEGAVCHAWGPTVACGVSHGLAILSTISRPVHPGTLSLGVKAHPLPQFEQRLIFLDECLHKLNLIQRKWVYLEPIFGRGALPQEQARFQSIDTEFTGIMGVRRRRWRGSHASCRISLSTQRSCIWRTCLASRTALMCSSSSSSDAKELSTSFWRTSGLASHGFTSSVRLRVPPRPKIWAGDDDLLQILGQAKEAIVIQSHLKKLFAGIHKVEFSEDTTQIVAMNSSQGETVPLARPVAVTEEVELWLQDLRSDSCVCGSRSPAADLATALAWQRL